VLIDFEELHRSYLVGRSIDGKWQHLPINQENPQTGSFPSTHQVFSNNGLQIALFIYNRLNPADQRLCTSVSHCLYLNFSHRVGGAYLLNKDELRLTFNLDLGVAGDLYGLAQGHTDSFSYSAVRSGKAPKRLIGSAFLKDGKRHISLRAESIKSGSQIMIDVELDRAALIALAAHCVGYGKLLYPSLSDSVIQTLLSESPGNFRACAENPNVEQPSKPQLPERLRRVIWAIGNKKWTSMTVEALQKIQEIEDPERAQAMIDEANQGNFRSWDVYLLD
jgi:hypothetical protein